jgi:hypothetical protein
LLPPTDRQTAAKQEIKMIEIEELSIRLAACRSSAFDFERASVILLAKHKHKYLDIAGSLTTVEHIEQMACCCDRIGQQGVHRHG